MPDWLDGLLKAVGALALVLGPAAAWRGHRLLRQTGRETAAATREAGDLKAATDRLVADIDTLKTRLAALDGGLALYKAYADGQAALVDATRAELAAERTARQAADLREVDCQHRLTRAETRIAQLERQRRGHG